MAAYQDKAIERIKGGLRKMNALITKAKAEKWQEADTRKIVLRTLTELLGWDEFDNVTGEYAIRGQYADYVIQKDGNILAVVEIKHINITLNEGHLRQASGYATNEGINLVLLTNGDTWKAYRSEYTDKAVITPIFTVTISDPDMKPAKKAELLYLLSEEASRKDEISDYYNKNVALSGDNLAARMLSTDMLDKLRLMIRRDTGYKVTDSELAEALIDRVIVPEMKLKDPDAIVRKVAAAERKSAQKPKPAEVAEEA